MEILRNGVEWQRWISFLLLACAVIAYRKLGAKDFPGYTRQFISKIDHDCRDFKGVLNRCHVWKDLGFCFKYRREMQHVCNRTCQYCVPGQKQWQVIDRAWGRVKEAARQPNSAHALVSPTLHKRPAIQILGKERAPQVDDAAIAIATQLENGIDHDVTGSPNVLGRLPNLHTKKATENDETKGKLFTSQSVPATELDHNEKAQSINSPASISGKTQVSETSTEDSPVVVLMGYELGKTTSKKVHAVLKNSESDQLSDGVFVNNRLTLRGNRTSNVKNGTERATAEKITTDNISPDSNLAKIAELLDNTTTASKHLHDKQHVHEGSGLQKVFTNDRSALRENGTSDVKNGAERTPAENMTTDNISPDSNLEKIAELLENAATARRHLHNKQHVHEGKKEHNADANTLQSKMHAAGLDNQTMGALKNKSAQHEKLSRSQGEFILPVSSDDIINQLAFHDQRMTSSSSHSPDYNNSDMHVPPVTSMVNDSSKRNSSEDTQPIDLSKTMAGNKYQIINDSSLQMNAPLRKPVLSDSPEKQVTVTVKPGTGEAIVKMQTSPHASYMTESIPGELPSPNYFLGNEEDRMKSEEEETKIREATQAIKNVIKLFDNGRRHGHTKLVSQAAQDFPAHSKSLEANPRELAGIDSEIGAQSQSEDRAAARAQALSQQIGQELSPNGMGTAASNVPNYAVISTRDSKDWKNLAHVLATQLKGVLNHMEDREKENQYQKNRMQEEMMMMTQRQRTMGRDEDEDPDDEDVDDDDDDREKRRHSVLLPHLKKGSDNTSRINYLKHKQSQRLKSGRHITEQKLLHRAVKKLSRLEMLHKSQQKR